MNRRLVLTRASTATATAAATTALAALAFQALPAHASEGQLNLQGYNATKAPWNARNAAGIAAAYTPEGTFQSPATGAPLNREAFTGYLGGLFTAMPDFKVTSLRTQVSADGKTITDEWLMEATWTQPFPGGQLAGAPPSGKAVKLPGVSVVQMEQGRIRSYTQYFDNLSFLMQLGVIPTPSR